MVGGAESSSGLLLLSVGLALSMIAATTGLIITGATVNWGPFAFLHSWEREVAAIEGRYASSKTGEIVFYGASNFARWAQLEENLAGYRVQNHAFGGSTDGDLREYAPRLLYPYDPAIVVLQTGSNDYVGTSGTDDARLERLVRSKAEMLTEFHRALPNAQFVVLSGIHMPRRSTYTPLVHGLNSALAELANRLDYVTFVDAEDLTWDGSRYDGSLFVADGIHLTPAARVRWADRYIRPALDELIATRALGSLRR